MCVLREKAPLLTQLIPEFICTSSECKGTWKEAFTRLLQGKDDTFLKNVRGDLTINDYLHDGKVIFELIFLIIV